jgi:hypothetical protein
MHTHTRTHVRTSTNARAHPALQDQCRREMAAGRTFRGLREAPITFRPTYKFDKGATTALAYDSSEKRRVPSWTDRIMFRGSGQAGAAVVEVGAHVGVWEGSAVQAQRCALLLRIGTRCLLLWGPMGRGDSYSPWHPLPQHSAPSILHPRMLQGNELPAGTFGPDDVLVRALNYSAWIDVADSDHKPVGGVVSL